MMTNDGELLAAQARVQVIQAIIGDCPAFSDTVHT